PLFHPVQHSFPTRRSSDLIVLRQPKPIAAKAPDRLKFAPPRQAFARRRVVGKERRCLRREVVGRLHVKRDQRPIELARNCAAKGDRKSTRLNSSHRTISYA